MRGWTRPKTEDLVNHLTLATKLVGNIFVEQAIAFSLAKLGRFDAARSKLVAVRRSIAIRRGERRPRKPHWFNALSSRPGLISSVSHVERLRRELGDVGADSPDSARTHAHFTGLCLHRLALWLTGNRGTDQIAMNDMNDGYWMIIFRRGKVFVPTIAKTEAGFYLAVEPVSVADESDPNAVEEAIMAAVERGNPVVPTPTRDGHKEYVLLKYAGVKSLSTFEKIARTWKLSKRGENFLIAPYRPGQYGGAEEDLCRQEALLDSVPLREVVRRLVNRALNESADTQGYAE